MSKDRSISGGTATSTGGFQTGRGASANRLPSAPRERKPALAALAVLLILAGALATMTLVTRSGNRVDVVQMKNTLSVGQKINPDVDLQAVSVAADNGVPYIRWDQRNDLRDRTTYNLLPQGAILIPAMLGEAAKSAAPAGTTVVGVLVKPGHFPFRNLYQGDKVNVYGSTTTTNGGNSSTTVTNLGTATIAYLGNGDTLSITLAAQQDVADKIVQAGDSITLTKAIG